MKRKTIMQTCVAAAIAAVLLVPVTTQAQSGTMVAWGREYVPPHCEITDLVDVASGARHILGLKADGSIVAWGYNAHNQCNVPAPNGDFVAVAAGWYHSLGLKADGSVVAWGQNSSGQCNVPEPNTGFVAIAAAYRHSLGLKADGSVVAWGYNYDGQCDVPEPNADFVDIAAGGGPAPADDVGRVRGFSIGLKSDGTVVAWGGTAPLPNPNADFIAVSAGYKQVVGLKSDGTAVAWNDWPMADVEGVTAVATGGCGFDEWSDIESVAVLLMADGSVMRSGATKTGPYVAVASGSNTRGNQDAAVRADGSIDIWGGQAFPISPDVVKVVSADSRHLALTADGTLYSWGNTYNGRHWREPLPNEDFVDIACGGEHCLALRADGSVEAWGVLPASSGGGIEGYPADPNPNEGFVAIASGVNHSVGLKSDGSIFAWDACVFGACDIPSPNSNYTAVAAGDNHTLALKADGSLRACGRNDYSQCNVPTASDFVAIAAAGHHNLALKSDGSIVGWGYNSHGQLDVPPPNTDFVAISTSYSSSRSHSLGLKSDGSIVAWGSNDNGQCNIPEPNSGFLSIAAGDSESFAVRELPACVATGMRSCTEHGTAGLLCTDLGTTGGIEARSDGVTSVEIDLDEAAGFQRDVSVTCENAGDVSASISGISVNGSTVTLDFDPALPDADACVIALDCGASTCLRTLPGDVNADGQVTTADASAVKALFGTAADAGNARFDVDASGTITTADYSTIKPLFGHAAPVCP